MIEEQTTTKFSIIDDFLPQKEFNEIQSAIMNHKTPQWVYTPNVANNEDESTANWKYFYFVHIIYDQGIVRSPIYNTCVPILNKLDVKALMQIKANLFPNSEKVHEHDKHIDYSWTHKGAILYINSCNGYTKLEDGTKVNSVANRILLFDASIPHVSTTTSNQTARFNINFNYF